MGTKININITAEKPESAEETDEKRVGLPRSGSTYTDEQLREMCDGMLDVIDRKDPIDDMFVVAFLSGMQFSCVKENAETHGMTVDEFARNSYGWCLQHVAMLDTRRFIASIFGK